LIGGKGANLQAFEFPGFAYLLGFLVPSRRLFIKSQELTKGLAALLWGTSHLHKGSTLIVD